MDSCSCSIVVYGRMQVGIWGNKNNWFSLSIPAALPGCVLSNQCRTSLWALPFISDTRDGIIFCGDWGLVPAVMALVLYWCKSWIIDFRGASFRSWVVGHFVVFTSTWEHSELSARDLADLSCIYFLQQALHFVITATLLILYFTEQHVEFWTCETSKYILKALGFGLTLVKISCVGIISCL